MKRFATIGKRGETMETPLVWSYNFPMKLKKVYLREKSTNIEISRLVTLFMASNAS